jgi:probable rRNA maturation factor
MTSAASALLFQHPSRKVRRRALRAFLGDLAGRIAGGRGVTCMVGTDAELRRLNREFRGQDFATDVLSFPAASARGTLGEIAISYDRAAAQAAERGHTEEDELRVLMLHGVLHLAGFDHETDAGPLA